MTPLQLQFLDVAMRKLYELKEERIKDKKGTIDRSLKDAYEKRKK